MARTVFSADPAFPDGAARVLVARGSIAGRAPDGFDPSSSAQASGGFTYEIGDELPARMAKGCFESFDDRVVVVDADDNVLHAPDSLSADEADAVVQTNNESGLQMADYDED